MKARKAAADGRKKTLRAKKSSVSTQVLTDNGMLVKRKRLSKRK
jgi:hypothetical protein